jgi:hypothetical protein
MLFEHRTYTLKPGATPSFWQAQVERGFALVEPIQQRLLGYFSARSGPADQVVHLYRYDGFDDWMQRLHGLYSVAALEPYFRTVRSLMLAQENKFLAPAPLAELTPIWGNGNDWLPGQPRPTAAASALGADAVVEEATTILLPGTLPSYWAAYREVGLAEPLLGRENLLGCFVSLVGRLHQVVHYRRFADYAARLQFIAARERDPRWQALQHVIGPLVASNETKLLAAAPVAELAPLFESKERHA